jgi:multiple antibiotic resistance protein
MVGVFVAVLASFFSVVDPVGAVPVFLSLTQNHTRAQRARIALNTSIYFVLISLSFFFAGSYILSFFGISVNAIRIAGGLVILSSGYSLLAGKFEQGHGMDKKVRQEALTKDDISFAPMAMPMLSGPGSISLLIGLYAQYHDWASRGVIAGVIIVCGVLVYLILRGSPFVSKFLGQAGMKALSRIMGFLVMTIGVQYIISGIVALVQGLV